MEKLKYYAKLATNKQGYVAAQLEVTSKCHQECPMCQSWREDHDNINAGTFTAEEAINLLKQFDDMPFFEHLSLTGGDPMAWPPLVEFINAWVALGKPFTLQVTTAMMYEPSPEVAEALKQVSTIRLSLDAVDAMTYQIARGVGRPDPTETLAWLEELGVPYSVLTTLSEYNSKSKYVLENICETLISKTRPSLFRKWMVLVQLGMKDEAKQAILMDRYTDFTTKVADGDIFVPFEVSFENESVAELPALKALAQKEKWDCYAGVLGCHIKANGDIYPCCLVGGEAVSTDAAFVIGNVKLSTLRGLHKRYCDNMITDAYSCEACQAVCLYKQTKINQYAHAAKSIALAIP